MSQPEERKDPKYWADLPDAIITSGDDEDTIDDSSYGGPGLDDYESGWYRDYDLMPDMPLEPVPPMVALAPDREIVILRSESDEQDRPEPGSSAPSDDQLEDTCLRSRFLEHIRMTEDKVSRGAEPEPSDP